MDEKNFLNWCKEEILKYTHANVLKIDRITKDDIFVVWCCKTLQNNKALLATKAPDNMYYECTYNGDKKEMYIDAYTKLDNYAVKLPEEFK